MKTLEKFIGVDLKGHMAVVANPDNGEVWKLGNDALDVHKHTKNEFQK